MIAAERYGLGAERGACGRSARELLVSLASGREAPGLAALGDAPCAYGVRESGARGGRQAREHA